MNKLSHLSMRRIKGYIPKLTTLVVAGTAAEGLRLWAVMFRCSSSNLDRLIIQFLKLLNHL